MLRLLSDDLDDDHDIRFLESQTRRARKIRIPRLLHAKQEQERAETSRTENASPETECKAGGSDLDQIVFDRVNDQIGRILTTRLGQNVRAMLVDRPLGNEQRVGDLVVRLAPADMQQNLGLALRQLLGTVVRNGRRRRLQVADQIEKKLLREEAPSSTTASMAATTSLISEFFRMNPLTPSDTMRK